MALFVTNDFPPQRGGIQRMISRLAGEFSTYEETIVVAPSLPGGAAYDAAQPFSVMRYRELGRAGSFLSMFVCALRAGLRPRKHVTIASIWFPSGLALCLLPSWIRGRLAVLAHGTEIAPQRGGIRRLLMRHVFRSADLVVANSSFTRTLLQEAGVSAPISVVNPGIDADLIAPARAAVPTVLSVGRLVARKGFDTMIRALPQIVVHYPTVQYEVVGSGPQFAELQELAEQLGVRSQVRFLGAVSDEEMRDAYARAWLFSLPVRAIEHDVEGFGMVYLEAALAALPVIGGSRSGAEDAIVAGETGLLVDGTDVSDVANAVISLLTDRERAVRMGMNGKKRAIEYFTWERAADDLAHLLGLERPRSKQPTHGLT